MKYFYDRSSDSLYLSLAERRAYRDSVEAAPGVVLDFDKAGRLLGIDLERASRIIDVSDLELHEEPSRADAEAAQLDGGELRRKREELGLSQVELGRRLSVSPNTVARWERGELKIEHPAMLDLALSSLHQRAVASQVSSAMVVERKKAHPPRDRKSSVRSTRTEAIERGRVSARSTGRLNASPGGKQVSETGRARKK